LPFAISALLHVLTNFLSLYTKQANIARRLRGSCTISGPTSNGLCSGIWNRPPIYMVANHPIQHLLATGNLFDLPNQPNSYLGRRKKLQFLVF